MARVPGIAELPLSAPQKGKNASIESIPSFPHEFEKFDFFLVWIKKPFERKNGSQRPVHARQSRS
jgi:hypothetical protein